MKFDRIYLEISNICNLQCTFCPVVERDKKIMSFEQIKQALMKVKDFADQICLHLMGEPLAHPQFKEIIDFCEQEKIFIQITTNGILAKKLKSVLSSKTIRQINFSLQSFLDNFPDKSFPDYFNEILDFCDYLKNQNPNTYINFRLWNIGDKTIEHDLVYEMLCHHYKVDINMNVDVSHRKSKKVVERVYLHFDSRFEWPSLMGEYQGEIGRCHGLSSHIGIHADGTVVPCCLDKEAIINLGNIFENSIDEILSGQRAIDIISGFKNNKRVEELCKKCSYINRFSK